VGRSLKPLELMEKQKLNESTVPIIDVRGKRTLEYVTDCVIKFNRSAEKVILRSVMGNISKAKEVARIVKDWFWVWYLRLYLMHIKRSS
jgi:DNA-binding protein